MIGVAGLGAATIVHAAWAGGSTWPRPTSDTLADLVVGRRPFPSRPLTAAVTGLLAAGTITVATSDGLPDPIRRRFPRLSRFATRTVGVASLVRGVGGLVASGLDMLEVTEEFRRWDLRLYSSLCVLLGVACSTIGFGRSAETATDAG